MHTIDSIIKLVGLDYLEIFSRSNDLYKIFYEAYLNSSEEIRIGLFKLYYSWKHYIDSNILELLNRRCNFDELKEKLKRERPEIIDKYDKYNEDVKKRNEVQSDINNENYLINYNHINNQTSNFNPNSGINNINVNHIPIKNNNINSNNIKKNINNPPIFIGKGDLNESFLPAITGSKDKNKEADYLFSSGSSSESEKQISNFKNKKRNKSHEKELENKNNKDIVPIKKRKVEENLSIMHEKVNNKSVINPVHNNGNILQNINVNNNLSNIISGMNNNSLMPNINMINNNPNFPRGNVNPGILPLQQFLYGNMGNNMRLNYPNQPQINNIQNLNPLINRNNFNPLNNMNNNNNPIIPQQQNNMFINNPANNIANINPNNNLNNLNLPGNPNHINYNANNIQLKNTNYTNNLNILTSNNTEIQNSAISNNSNTPSGLNFLNSFISKSNSQIDEKLPFFSSLTKWFYDSLTEDNPLNEIKKDNKKIKNIYDILKIKDFSEKESYLDLFKRVLNSLFVDIRNICSICGYRTNQYKKFIEHLDIHFHINYIKKNSQKKDLYRRESCSKHSWVTNTVSNYSNYLNSNKNENVNSLSTLNSVLYYLTDSENHLNFNKNNYNSTESENNENMIFPVQEKEIKCIYCKEEFKKKYFNKYHFWFYINVNKLNYEELNMINQNLFGFDEFQNKKFADSDKDMILIHNTCLDEFVNLIIINNRQHIDQNYNKVN